MAQRRAEQQEMLEPDPHDYHAAQGDHGAGHGLDAPVDEHDERDDEQTMKTTQASGLSGGVTVRRIT